MAGGSEDRLSEAERSFDPSNTTKILPSASDHGCVGLLLLCPKSYETKETPSGRCEATFLTGRLRIKEKSRSKTKRRRRRKSCLLLGCWKAFVFCRCGIFVMMLLCDAVKLKLDEEEN